MVARLNLLLTSILLNHFMKRIFAVLFLGVLFMQGKSQPNVIIIYTDDVGYGDLSCYGATAIVTPNIDKLANGGLRFTNAHCTAATCTPSRYSLISGQYAWRRKGTDILPGNANLIVPTNTTTLPKVFQRAGYSTAVVGKWHLGLGDSVVDWNKPIAPGPKEAGFDYSFIFPATADRTPTVFLENQKVIGLDEDSIQVNYQRPFPNEMTGKNHPEMLRMKNDPKRGHDGHITNGIGRIGFMKGGKRAEWKDEDLGIKFHEKAISFIDETMKNKKSFFLYYSMHSIHVPRMPATRFQGKSKLGARGDAILEMDYNTGLMIEALKQRDLLKNTLIIFSSDNGPVLNDGYFDQSAEAAKALKYKPAGIYSGGKYSVLEGGTRVPFIVYWENQVKPAKSGVLFSQMDLMASFAAMLHQPLPDEFTDSRNYLETMIGKSRKERDYIVEQPSNNALAIVKGQWKYITPSQGKPFMEAVEIQTGFSQEDQLYDLKNDPRELNNLATKKPKKVEELKALLAKVKSEKTIDNSTNYKRL